MLTGRLRRWMRRVHLVLGLALTVVISIVAVTGTFLVFRDEITKLLPAINEWDGQSDIGYAAAHAIALEAQPEGQLQLLWFPTRARPYYQAAYKIGEEEFTGYLYWDPATGRPLQALGFDVFEWLTTLHISLHLGDFVTWLVKWSTLLFAILLLSGLVLWWPGWRPHLWMKVRPGKLFTWDLHRVAGFVAAPFLMLMTLTGLVIAFPVTSNWVITGILGGGDASQPAQAYLSESTVPTAPAEPATDAKLLRDALALSPADAFIFYISYPLGPTDNRQVRMQRGYQPYPYGRVYRVYFDQYSGGVLATEFPDGSLSQRYLNDWNGQLHFGTFGGWFTLVLWFLIPLSVPMLTATGILLWLRRRSRRTYSSKRPAVPPVPMAPAGAGS